MLSVEQGGQAFGQSWRATCLECFWSRRADVWITVRLHRILNTATVSWSQTKPLQACKASWFSIGKEDLLAKQEIKIHPSNLDLATAIVAVWMSFDPTTLAALTGLILKYTWMASLLPRSSSMFFWSEARSVFIQLSAGQHAPLPSRLLELRPRLTWLIGIWCPLDSNVAMYLRLEYLCCAGIAGPHENVNHPWRCKKGDRVWRKR